jgi:geranylgeranyl diphosphate synthase type II
MIGGQYLDISGADGNLAELDRLKTGRLFAAAVGLGLEAAGLAEGEQAAWRAFGEELGLLFQVVDDILDGDGFVERVGTEAARALADQAAVRARACLEQIPADTSVLLELVDTLAVRTA